jgi:uncharacterized membrane protein YphA (DoxX/SURF4 family)
MNTLLWVLQILLAGVFLAAGLAKLTQSKEKLLPRMEWVRPVPPGLVKALGAAEVLGAVGLVLPGLTGIATVLTPLAAVGLVVVMIGAVGDHLRRHEYPKVGFTALLLVASAIVAWGRFGPYPL